MDDRNKQQFARRFIELPEEKRVLFLKGLEKEGLDFGLFPIVPDVNVDERNELSYTQQRMWFLWQLDPQSAAYNLPSAIRIQGALDQAVFGQAFDHLIARHDTLRTRFESTENQSPRQFFDPPASVVIRFEDLSHLSESEREASAEETAKTEAQIPFDLAEGPLFRVRLLKLSDDQHILLLTMHHIIADGWSMNVIIEEFLHLYDAYSAGSEPSLQSLPIQYADYALWQRSWLEAGEADRQLDYWRSKLGEEHPVLELPVDHIRPATPSYTGERKEFSLSQPLGQALRTLAGRSNATLFMVLLAGFNILLHRYTGQNKLCVGSPVANRNRPETEGLIGCFINTQVLYTELDGPLTVAELIEQVRVSTLEAQEHQDLPFEKLVDGLRLERNVSHNPLFQVMFNHQSNVADVSEITTASGLSLEPLNKVHQSVEVDLRLDSWEKGGELHIALTWATDLFEVETVERFGQHLLSIFDSMVSNPQARIGELPLLGQDDRQLMLQQWNSTQTDYPRNVCLPQLFEAQVEKTPEAIALLGTGEEEGQSLTYRQLNSRANQLAQRLRDKGVGPEVFVGVATERCMDMVVSLLAIMKAGGAYVPLDPAFPEDRLAYMLEHSGLKLLLSQQHLQAALPELDKHASGKETSDIEVLWLDSLSYSDENAQNSVPQSHAGNLAYTIYTSGSTGKPKGVAISHQCLVNFLFSMAQQPGIDAQDRVVALTSLSFDIAGLELYLPLISGAGIIMLDNAATKDPQKILAAAEHHQASFIQATPSTWKMLLSVDDPGYLSRCKILTGGEALPEALADEMLAYADSVWNVYGPTETTIWSALYRMDKEHSLPYLGNPIANTSIYILNDELEPQPVGVAGDLYIGGEGLARGYQHRPDLTAERFVPSPFEAEQGACLYRTGDLARYRTDGSLEYIGRSDFQVKVRGYRIELGEIESQLHKQTGVQDAAVVAQESQHGHQLVAYVVPEEAALLETEESVRTGYLTAIKQPLQSALPEYMVPAQWMLLDKMPLTPNGKLDRKALPKVDGSNFQKVYEAPQTELEQQLAAIWQEVLGLEQIGLNDNFFELGGHSLLLTQVVSRVRQTLSLELPLRVLFEARDLRSFAEKVEQSAGVTSEAAQAIMPVSRDQVLPLSYAQQRQWVLWQLEPDSAAYHMTAALRMKGELNVAVLQQSFDWLFERHEVLRTHFTEIDGQLGQVIEPHQSIHIETEQLDPDQISQKGEESAVKEALKTLEAVPFDLSQGPLLRVNLLRISEQDHVLALIQHHVVSDRWSMQVMLNELVQAYVAFSQGETPAPEALPIQYADYAIWQREYLAGDEGERQLDYWREQLGTEHPVLELPTDRPRPQQPSYQGDALSLPIDTSLYLQLQAVAKRHGVTLHMLLLAAFQTLLQRYSGQNDIRVGVPVAGRTHLETEHLLGLFVNTQVLRADFNPDLTFTDLLNHTRQATIDAQANQDLPFEQLVDALQPERSLSCAPLFQVMFNYQSRQDTRENLDNLVGMVIEPFAWNPQTSIFDLTLDIAETDDELYSIFSYATDLFEASTIEKMGRHWCCLLQRIADNSEIPVGSLSVLSTDEQIELIQTLNPFYPDAPARQTVQQKFEAMAQTQPDQIAVVLADEQLTYTELNSRTNQLAHRLMAAGIGPDALVGVSMERSIEMIVGVMAILKAGGAFVPLDPAYPEDRLVHMANDSGLNVLLTQKAVDQNLPFPADIQRIYLDDSCEAYSDDNPVHNSHGKNLAYMIFTSGTTGLPKGVGIDQGSLARHVEVYSERLGLNANDNVLQYATLNFDTFGEQVFPTLCTGGSVIMRGEELWDHETFYQNLHRYGISVANMTPSMWYQLIKEFAARGLTDFGNWRRMIVGGEAMPPDALATWQQLGLDKQAQLWNFYGPTEATAASTSYHCAPVFEGDGPLPATVPIGEALKGRGVYIVDRDLNLVPTGVIGELVVGGELLARGYHNRSGLTAERFIADPFSELGGRLYRTGDLARYDQNGTIEYLGRTDHQVKIRGFRVELGEIESQLRAHEQVQDAIVIPHEINGSQQLVAYLIPADSTLVTAEEQHDACFQLLKVHLHSGLPDYMVPLSWVMIEAVPLTPNGKVDRKALPTIESSDFQKEYEAPASALEYQLAEVWQSVLGLERVGRNDNFFELGGDSIVSLQLVSRARQQGLQFTPKDIFQHQTLRGLSTVVVCSDHAIDAEQHMLEGHVDLNPMQSWFFAEDIPESQHWNQSVLLRLHKPVVAKRIAQGIAHLLTHHDALRLTFDEHYQGNFGPADVDILWHRKVADETALTDIANEAQRSLDLKQGPLLRVVLFDFPNGEQRLLWVIHHLVVDGVSWRILLEDFQAIYEQLESHTDLVLPAKTSSVRAWSQQLREFVSRGALRNELEYWQNTLADVRGDLPQDNPAGCQQNRYAQSVSSRLDKALTEQLLKEAPGAYRTQINDLLLTSLARVICRWTKESSALIALEGHGREDLFDNIDLTRTVGWFTSLFPVKLTPSLNFDCSIKTIKEQLRSVPNKGVGYGILRYLSDEETRQCLAVLPEARITFNYLGQFDNSFGEAQGALFSPISDNRGEEQGDEAPLSNWLSINGQVYGGELTLDWSFSGEVYHAETIQVLADDYTHELTQLIAHCVAQENNGLTPSDFPLTQLTQSQLDHLPVAAETIDDIYPLSPMQQGMLFHSLSDLDEDTYINQLRVDVKGLNVDRFYQAWQDTLEQHDILRAGFIWENVDTPIQVIYKNATLPLTVHDWRGRDELKVTVDRLAGERLKQGFVLNEAPLLILDLIQISDTCYHMIYTNHHILMDGWSASQLFGEVLQRYKGQPYTNMAGSYRDYLVWLQRQDLAGSQKFWTEQLSALEQSTLLSDAIQSKPEPGDLGWEHIEYTLNHDETQRLGELAKAHKVTVNTVLQSAWLLLLQRYTGQKTVTFGATVAGRPTDLPGSEQQLGLFINTLPVVSQIDDTDSVGEFLGKVQAQNLALREYEHTPLYEIQRWSGQGGTALFDTIMVFENYPISEALKQSSPSGLEFGELHNHEQTNYGLTLSVNLVDQLHLECCYDRRQFSDEMMMQVMGQLQHILKQFTQNSEQLIRSLPMLTSLDREHILYSWNQLSIPGINGPEQQQPVYARIAAQTELTPDAVALVYEEQVLTFRELEQRVDQVAWRLHERGAQPGVLVGLSVGRTTDMVVSLLAILKTGAAYVTLDPEYPADRLAHMISDSGIQLLLSEASFLSKLPVPEQVDVLLIEPLADSILSNSVRFPLVNVHPESLAYVLYTSGSTGKPKGVAMSHRALSDHVSVVIDYFELTAKDRMLQFSSLNFDGFMEQLFPALCVGGSVVIRGNEIWDGETFYRELKRTGFTVVDVTTAYWYMLVQDLAERAKREQPDYGPLRQISLGGEAMPAQGISAWQQAGLEKVRLFNTYGPTEAAITSSYLDCADYVSGQQPLPAAMPIGQGLAGRAMYILDGTLEPAPIGVIGELYIGGPLLAEGYYNRPDLTSERFIADPFTDVAGARMYASGDLAYYRADGTIEYAGRADFQVKIRGFRIELGEIESELQGLPELRDAVVVAQAGSHSQQLVAYVVPSDVSVLSQDSDVQTAFISGIKSDIAERLPEYMVPAQVALLAEMPLTPGGKIDRKALPEVDTSLLQKAYEAPATALEQQLAGIWQDVLGVEQVGLSDNFFELGGHSLLATQVIARVRQVLLIDLPLRTLFEVSELRNFAERVVQADDYVDTAEIPIVPRDQDLPPSYAQQRQWVMWKLEPESSAYHMTAALRLKGELDNQALQHSFNWLAERHEVLRTSFIETDGVLHQVIEPYLELELITESLIGKEHSDEALNTKLQSLANEPFDLGKGPLLRIRLLQLSEQEYVLTLIQHHVVSDEWSMQLMVSELVEAYGAFRQEKMPSTSDLPIQYADYAIWQREYLAGEEGERQLAYWQEQLGTEHPVLELPADHPRPQQSSYQGAVLDFALDATLQAQLMQEARRQGVTMHMLLLASFQALLYRYSGQNEIRVGVPIANRTRLETEKLIGFFVNTQVLRADFHSDLTFADLLRNTRQATLDAQANQDLPFEQLVEALQPERSLNYSPLFQVMFNYLSEQGGQSGPALQGLNDLAVEAVEWGRQTSLFDLTLDVTEAEAGLMASFTYATDLFERSTIEKLAGHWQQLLQAIVDDSEQTVQCLSILSAEETAELILTLNPFYPDAPTELSVQQKFEARALAQPDEVAVVLGDEQLTYAELNRRANQLAHRLIEAGIGPDGLVGISVERSIEMIVGVMAILKAGGAFVPLDPAYPEDRLVHMVNDSGLSVLLTQRGVDQGLPFPAAIQRIYLEESCESYSESNPAYKGHAKNLAYMIFTSGTTGLPKGVGIDQGSLARHIEVYSERLELNADDNVLQYATLNFDTFGEQVFPTLCTGGSVIMRGEELWDHDTFYHNLHRYGISVANMTPSMWYQLIKEFAARGLTDFGNWRRMIVGGEAMPPDALATWQQLGLDKQAQLWNFYGPTEATAASTSYNCAPVFETDGPMPATVPIGETLKGRGVYIVDADLNLVPTGVIGELVVGGELLARGYHNRASLTAERFVADPFSAQGGRLYRTGDLARYDSNGVIEYLGRTDHQVKIRGFRVELGEIESQLRAHKQLKDVVVVAQEVRGSQQLVGYLLPRDPELADAENDKQRAFFRTLKSHLQSGLPDYMVPAYWMMISEVPLTPNGKVNHKALPPVDASSLQETYEAPGTVLEQRLAEIWQDVLGLEQVGLNDNFFELGGHSLLLTQVVSRVRQALAIELPLKALFEARNLRSFAAQVTQSEGLETFQPITPVSREQALPLSYAQQRQWVLWQLEPESTAYHIPAALRMKGALDIDSLQRSFDWLIARHETLRTHFVNTDSGAQQIIEPHISIPLVVESISADTDKSLEAALSYELQAMVEQPFDLSQGPLLRIKLIRLSEDEHVLALVQHHIVSDAWSMQLMVEELVEAYSAFSQGAEPKAEALPVQYADFAVWQRERLAGEEGERQMDYWSEHLGSEHHVLELPLDHPRPQQRSYAGAVQSGVVSECLYQQLQQLATQQGVTLNMLLLASFQAFLHRYSGQDEICVGVPVANRNRLETEGLIGFFVNTLVQRADFTSDLSFAELLAQTKQRSFDAQTHQDLPFEQLVDALQPERSLSHSPLFQVMFNYLSAHGSDSVDLSELDGLKIEGVTPSVQTAQFDLTLDIGVDNDGISFAFNYATDLFAADTIDRMIQHWQRLLEAIVDDPTQRVMDLPLQNVVESQFTLSDWNKSTTTYNPISTLQGVFEEQVAKYPEATAVVFDGESLSYSELNQRANRLAHRLRALGVGPDDLVGLCVERSLEMMVGLFAILKAGGAYVPLDPAYPEDRLTYICEDSGLSILLTQKDIQERIPTADSVQILLLDDENNSEYSEENLPNYSSTDNLAYIIYTSGSTGKPKGVLQTHHNVLRLLLATDKHFGFNHQDVWTLFHSYAFDFSVWEIFGALLYGGKLVIPSHEVTRSPDEFFALMCEEGVSVLNQTPSAFRQLMPIICAQREQASALRYVIFGGEALEIDTLRPWYECFGEQAAQLINMYGITETTVHVTYYPVSANDESGSPIGDVIDDLTWYVLDDELNPVIPGCTGELYVGGMGLARGYQHRGALTSERFIANPFAEDGSRLYRTGDLARYRTDRSIEYIGRSDQQVKIRGFRIELGEIEAQLLDLPGISDVTVLAQEGVGGQQLVAYIVPTEIALVEADTQTKANILSEVKTQLHSVLPDYMVPTQMMLLDKMPLTSNGKLDRKALPSIDVSSFQKIYEAPTTDLEVQIADIWQELLGVESIGLNDNFFELGGHSLLATQVIARLQIEMKANIAVTTLFTTQNLKEFAGLVANTINTNIEEDLQDMHDLLAELQESV